MNNIADKSTLDELSSQLDQIAGYPISQELLPAFRNMERSRLETCCNDLQAIYSYFEKHAHM